MALTFPSSDFWDFSLALYGKPGVAPACLALQERHGLDVNVLMFCLWLAASGRGPASVATLHTAFAAAESWHVEVVRHVRALRRRLKSPVGAADQTLAQALRARIQKIEIDAEHIEQLTLEATAPAVQTPKTDHDAVALAAEGAVHAATYCRHIGAGESPENIGDLGAILAAAFAINVTAARAEIARAFATAGR